MNSGVTSGSAAEVLEAPAVVSQYLSGTLQCFHNGRTSGMKARCDCVLLVHYVLFQAVSDVYARTSYFKVSPFKPC